MIFQTEIRAEIFRNTDLAITTGSMKWKPL